MKKIILIATLFLLISGLVNADPGQKKTIDVNEFTGGLNLVTDSIDIDFKESLRLDNVDLSRFGALHKRYGYENWNDSTINQGEYITNIHYLEKRDGSKELYIAAGNYIYTIPSWQDSIDGDDFINWDTLRIKYDLGHLDSIGGRIVYAEPENDSTAWQYHILPNDRLVVGDSTYQIDSILSDWSLYISGITTPSEVESVPGGNIDYHIDKYIGASSPELTSWDGKLFVSDITTEPWWYDGEFPYILGIVDSGTVYDVYSTTTPTYTRGSDGSFSIRGPDCDLFITNDFLPSDSMAAGDLFTITCSYQGQGNQTRTSTASFTIIEAGSNFVLVDQVIGGAWVPPIPFNILPYFIIVPGGGFQYTLTWNVTNGNQITPENTFYIVDSTKTAIWDYTKFSGLWIINANDADVRGKILDNTNVKVYYDTTVVFAQDDKYYIAWQTPAIAGSRTKHGTTPSDSVIMRDVRFKKMIFHRNRLYGIGYEYSYSLAGHFPWTYVEAEDSLKINYVWYAELGKPSYILPLNNFDVTGANRNLQSNSIYQSQQCQDLFVLKDDLYVMTNTSIYKVQGEPVNIENLTITQPVKNLGTDQTRAVTTTDDNTAYFMNKDGIYLFDGNFARKISYKVNPLVETNRSSAMVAGRWKDMFLFSYPEQSETIVLHEPTKAFTTWDFGIGFINQQPVMVDSNYFLFSTYDTLGYVNKYPRNTFAFLDRKTPFDSTIIPFRYNSGWQTLGNMNYDKVIDYLSVIAYNPGVSVESGNDLRIYRNFVSSTPAAAIWDSTSFATGDRINRFKVGSGADSRGYLWQIEVVDSTQYDFFLGGYKIDFWDISR